MSEPMMIERVATAIWLADFRHEVGGPPPDWSALPQSVQERYVNSATAAMEAMRPPTVEMVVDATEEWLCVRAQEDRAEVIWDAMLDTALGYPR